MSTFPTARAVRSRLRLQLHSSARFLTGELWIRVAGVPPRGRHLSLDGIAAVDLRFSFKSASRTTSLSKQAKQQPNTLFCRGTYREQTTINTGVDTHVLPSVDYRTPSALNHRFGNADRKKQKSARGRGDLWQVFYLSDVVDAHCVPFAREMCSISVYTTTRTSHTIGVEGGRRTASREHQARLGTDMTYLVEVASHATSSDRV